MVLFGVPSLVRKDGEVERIDRVNPMAAIGGLLEIDSRQTPKAGVHTKLTLPVTFADSGSGVKKVEYAWTNTAGTPSGGWQQGAVTVTFSADDDQSGIGKKYYKLVKTDAEIPKEGLTELTSDSVRVDGNGVWYVYYRFYDRAGDETVGRETNKTEGFVGPVRIDVTAPALAVACGTSGVLKSDGLPVSVKAEYGMSGGSVRVGGGERSV